MGGVTFFNLVWAGRFTSRFTDHVKCDRGLWLVVVHLGKVYDDLAA